MASQDHDDEDAAESFVHSGSSNQDDDDEELEGHHRVDPKKKDKPVKTTRLSIETVLMELPRVDNIAQCLTFCKRFWVIVISNMLLFFLVAAYAIFGGLLFFSLEAKKSLKHEEFLETRRMETVFKLLSLTEASPDFDIENDRGWIDQVNKIMEKFQKFVESEEAIYLKTQKIEWNLMSSIVYSVTLITTIGYGNLAPVTDEGRVVTIWYSIIGIPLTLLYLTSIGAIMADLFRFVYNKIASLLGKNVSKGYGDVSIRVPVSVTMTVLVLYVTAGAIMFQVWERRWDFITSAYFCFITLSTIGLGDFVFGFDEAHQDPWKQLVSSMYLFLGLSVMSMAFNLLRDEIVAKYNMIIEGMTKLKPQTQSMFDSERASSSF
ncbi:hypothetical protein Btru_032111 [Bulinus truncatus]|nr:hypothetical protein Btru_032111 [Bulinus truncatus]